MRSHFKTAGRLAVLAALGLAAVSCDSDSDTKADSTTTVAVSTAASTATSDTTSSTGASQSTTSIGGTDGSAITTPVSADAGGAGCTSDDPIKVVYIPKNLGNPYFDSVVAGLEEAAKTINMDVSVVGPAQAGASDQIQYIDAAVQQHVDAIAISPNDPSTVVPSLKRAMDAGITVIAVNSDMDVDGRQLAVLPVDFSKLGDFLLTLTADVTGGAGDYAILSATSTAPDQNSWIDGMKAAGPSTAPGLKLVDVVYGDDAPEKSADEARALLTKYPDLAAINAPTTVGLAAAAQVLSSSPQKGKVQITGLGTPNQMREYIKDGTVIEFGLWSPKAEGVLSAYAICGLVTGSLKATAGSAVNVPGVGDNTVTDETQLITGPPVVFNASNIDQFDF